MHERLDHWLPCPECSGAGGFVDGGGDCHPDQPYQHSARTMVCGECEGQGEVPCLLCSAMGGYLTPCGKCPTDADCGEDSEEETYCTVCVAEYARRDALKAA